MQYWYQVKVAARSQAIAWNEAAVKSGESGTQDTELWIYKAQDEMKAELLGLFGDKAISQAFALITQKGFLCERMNPRFPWDKTRQYLFNVEAVQGAIDAAPNPQNCVHRTRKNAPSREQECAFDNAEMSNDARANPNPPKSTTESTTEETRAPAPKTFPRPEPRLSNYVAHLLWRIEMSDGALMTSRAASRNARIALELLGVAAEDKIVSAYEWRKRNAREGVVYEFRFLADDINGTLAAMAAKPRAKRAADKTLQDLAAEIGDDVDNLRAKGMLPTREQIRAGYYDAGKKQSW
jgi:hypothetical protein